MRKKRNQFRLSLEWSYYSQRDIQNIINHLNSAVKRELNQGTLQWIKNEEVWEEFDEISHEKCWSIPKEGYLSFNVVNGALGFPLPTTPHGVRRVHIILDPEENHRITSGTLSKFYKILWRISKKMEIAYQADMVPLAKASMIRPS